MKFLEIVTLVFVMIAFVYCFYGMIKDSVMKRKARKQKRVRKNLEDLIISDLDEAKHISLEELENM